MEEVKLAEEEIKFEVRLEKLCIVLFKSCYKIQQFIGRLVHIVFD